MDIRFFSPIENNPPQSKPRKEAKPITVSLTGYISSAGKLVLPDKTVANLGIDLDTTTVRVGIQAGKRKAKSLYLIPTSGESETFSFQKAGYGYTLGLPLILTKSGIDYRETKYGFTIQLFEYEGTTAFELQVAPKVAPAKVPYTGKPRGRKPKGDQVG